MARVLVTGARRGIGRATLTELARRGHQVVGGVRQAEHADELRAMDVDAPGTVDAVVLDLMNPESIAAGARTVTASGPLDAVVNNAAILPVAPVEFSDVGTIRATFETNVVGPMLLAAAVLPALRAQGHGLFVTISSASRHPRIAPSALGVAYAASKAAVDCLAESFNREIAGFGLRSAIVELGGFDTEMTTADRFAADVVPADSPYAAVATVLEDLIISSPKAQPADGARCIADVIELADPPMRTVFPPELAGLIAAAPKISDEAYLAQCVATSGKDWFRALRRSLGG
jgi:NAD(P)-dependent dehydrogenase (short-subunit alcohol dehydrogenase family)